MLTTVIPECDAGPCPTVQLRHTLPDGSSHVDWLIARSGEPGTMLISFRLPAPLHEQQEGATLEAEVIGDHRPKYLDYEGPVSDDRGEVRRLSRGVVEDVQRPGPDSARLIVTWTEGPKPGLRQSLRLAPHQADRLVVVLETVSRAGRNG